MFEPTILVLGDQNETANGRHFLNKQLKVHLCLWTRVSRGRLQGCLDATSSVLRNSIRH